MDVNDILDIMSLIRDNSELIGISKIVKKYKKNPRVGYLMNSEFIFHRDFCFGLNAVVRAVFGSDMANELPIIFTPGSGCKYETACFHCRSCRPCLYDFNKYLLLTSLVGLREIRQLIFSVYSD